MFMLWFWLCSLVCNVLLVIGSTSSHNCNSDKSIVNSISTKVSFKIVIYVFADGNIVVVLVHLDLNDCFFNFIKGHLQWWILASVLELCEVVKSPFKLKLLSCTLFDFLEHCNQTFLPKICSIFRWCCFQVFNLRVNCFLYQNKGFIS